MDSLSAIRGMAAPMPVENIDTDMIIPRQYLKTTTRTGLGRALFHDYRYDATGTEVPNFVLNKPEFREAKILIALDNFACGSAREHACWALKDFGFRSVIAPSFSTFFQSNCYQNGLVPVMLPRSIVSDLIALAHRTSGEFVVNIKELVVAAPDQSRHSFAMPAYHRENLLAGRDEIALTMQRASSIASFEARQRSEEYWRFGDHHGES